MIHIIDIKGKEIETKPGGNYYPGQTIKVNGKAWRVVSVVTYRNNDKTEIFIDNPA